MGYAERNIQRLAENKNVYVTTFICNRFVEQDLHSGIFIRDEEHMKEILSAFADEIIESLQDEWR